ncbi:MAG: MFS transporter [Chloroflexi bacterium]|nr:MFS transporter [Chloroflexota bacterium]MQC26886.1 MFS transporter [Chloroflexota bacterium]
MPRLSWPRLFALSAFAFAITLVANSLDPAVFGHKVLQLLPEKPNTLLGLSTFAASVLSMALGPIVGAWSDRTQSRHGRRMPFFLAGVPVLIAALYIIALAPSVMIFVLGVLLFRLGDNLIFPPWQALFPDYVPPAQRGIGAGIKSLLDILALLIGRFAAGELVAQAPILGQKAVVLAVTVPAVGLLIALVTTRWALRELPARNEDELPRQGLLEAFKINWRARPAFTWWFINRTFFWTGFTILGTFLLFFVIDVIGFPEAEAQRYLARLSLVLGGAILLIAVPSGWLADRLGRKPLVVSACVLITVGTGMIVLVREPSSLIYAAALVGLGAGIFISADFALLTDIVPANEAGRYLGISNIASAGGGAVARLLGGLIIDPVNALTGSAAIGYLSLYGFAAVLFFFSILAALKLSAEEAPSAD